jgi:hypothetical protein
MFSVILCCKCTRGSEKPNISASNDKEIFPKYEKLDCPHFTTLTIKRYNYYTNPKEKIKRKNSHSRLSPGPTRRFFRHEDSTLTPASGAEFCLSFKQLFRDPSSRLSVKDDSISKIVPKDGFRATVPKAGF